MKLVCVKCEVELKPSVNGTIVIETMRFAEPYKIWSADTWKCPGCDVEIVAGFGMNPIAEHFQSGFEDKLEAAKSRAKKLVYDHERVKEQLP